MTTERAAKLCVDYVDGVDRWDDDFRARVERYFTEVISQVTPPLTLEQEMAWMAHQKQKNLNLWMGQAITATGATIPRNDDDQAQRRREAEQRKNQALAQLALTCNRFPQEIEEPRSEAFRHKLEQAAADANAPMRVAFPWGMIWSDLKAAWRRGWKQ